ncbi:MAG: glycosyltransferase [Acidobacteria bacterium]|nr:glycosyltransferase [Acidobacteriota bacterium]
MPQTHAIQSIDLSFVVETLNLRVAHDYTPLDTALSALSHQTADRARYEILVVVDPAKEPGLRAHLGRDWPGVRVVEVEPGTHYYAMKNAGARAACGRLVGYVDADCSPVSTWADSIVEALTSGQSPPAIAVGSYDTPRSGESWIAKAFLITIFGRHAGRTQCATSSFAASNSAVLRERMLSDPFNDHPYFHGPDVEFASRALARGDRIELVPGATSLHDHEPGFAAQHGRGVYWGYCFLRLRRESDVRVPYGALFRRLGKLAPLALIPAKTFIDLRRAFQLRRDLALNPIAIAGVSGLLILNAFSVSLGAMRYEAGLPPPRQPQDHNFAR